MKTQSKKFVIISLIAIVFIFVAGAWYFSPNQQTVQSYELSKEIPDTYWEWKMEIAPLEVTDIVSDERRQYLEDNQSFENEGVEIIQLFDEGIEHVKLEANCNPGKTDCEISNVDMPKEYSGTFEEAFYDNENNLYVSVRGKDHFDFYKNGELIISVPTFFWTDGPIWNVGLVDGKLTFEYSNDRWETEEKWIKDGCAEAHEKMRTCSQEAEKSEKDISEFCAEESDFHSTCQERSMKERTVFMNLYYDGQLMNETFDMRSSKELFVYKNKIGFIGEKDEGYFIWFNGQKVSDEFDNIKTHGCCASAPYPFKLYEDGTLFFGAARDSQYYQVKIDLNQYLSL